jgi:hypothetical protein
MCELRHGMAGERHGHGMLCVNPPLQKPGREQYVIGLPIRHSPFNTLFTTSSVLRTSRIPRFIFFEVGNYNSGRSTFLYAVQSEEMIKCIVLCIVKALVLLPPVLFYK